eukprot:4119644-Amphidinium_carterae.1
MRGGGNLPAFHFHQKTFRFGAIADDHSFLEVNLHITLSLALLSVTITKVPRKVVAFGNKDHSIRVLSYADVAPSTLKSL